MKKSSKSHAGMPATQLAGQRAARNKGGGMLRPGSETSQTSNRSNSVTNNQSNMRKSAKLKNLPAGNQRGTSNQFTNKKVLPKIKSNVERFDDLLAGSLDDLPPKPPSEVRIFLSSTFSDYRMERNWLAKVAYGKLQQFCSGLGLDVRVVDMRWGVTDDATNEHITEKLCLTEIANCKRVSLGPNFAAMLGNRYGYQPLQYAFVAKEFDILYAEAESVGHQQVACLKEWYKRDDNNVPPVYCIQPIRSILPYFGDHSAGNEDHRMKATASWNEIHKTLHEIFRTAVSSLTGKGIITEARKHDFFKSVTECEVTDGMVEVDDAGHHALCYLRDFKDLDGSRLDDKNANRNIDTLKVDGKVVLNEEVIRHQSELKEKVIPRCLRADNVHQYSVEWQDGGLDPTQHPQHTEYLTNFCEDFVEDTKRLIQAALHHKQNLIPASEYYSDYEESLHHLHFCVSKCDTFQGQKDILNQIQTYLGDAKKTKPLTLYAASGVGKTSIMAMAMKLIPKWFGKETIRVIRFLGTSPNSGSLYLALRSVMGQLADNVDLIIEPISYGTPKKAIVNFPRFLRTISRQTNNSIFIFLDSIDQLSSADNAYSMEWLPKELPAKVHLIISMLPNHNNILENTRKHIRDNDCFIEVKPLPQETGEQIIDSYLKRQGRKVTAEQRELILKCLLKEPSPLFLKLFLDKALSWRSYTDVADVRMEVSVREAISHLLEDLEVKFGEVFISRTLGYITVGLNGLTELELEDVLSCDDTVLDEVYIYHDPPVEGTVRIPPLLWARVRIHINEYLAERNSYGKTTLFWYHRQFIEAAVDRYTKGNSGRVLNRRLAELYLSENGVKKDITLNKRKNLVIAKADRQVTPQAMVPTNRRMLEALPYHLQQAMNVSYLKQVALCNLRFLMTRMEAFSLEAVLKDFQNAIDALKASEPTSQGDHDLQAVLHALTDAKPSLRIASQLPLQLLCRLRKDRKAMPHVSNLLDQAQAHILDSPSTTVMPLYPCLSDINELKCSLSNATLCDTTADGTLLVIRLDNDSQTAADSMSQAKYIVLDCIGQRIASELLIDDNFTSPPSLLAEGKKLAVVKYLNELVPEVKSKGKPNKSSFTAGDIILEVIKLNETSAENVTQKICSKNTSAGVDTSNSKPQYSALSSDLSLLALGYESSRGFVMALIDVKKGNVIKTATVAGATSLVDITWIGKTHCVVTSQLQGDCGSVLIMNTTPKKKEAAIRLPSSITTDSFVILREVGVWVGLVSTDEGSGLAVIETKTGVLHERLILPDGHPVLLCHISTQKSVFVINDKKCLFKVSSFLEPIIEQMSGFFDHEMTCVSTDPDGEYVMTGDLSGDLHVARCDHSTLTSLGHVTLHPNPLTHILVNKDEDIIVTTDTGGEVKLWNFRLLLPKCQRIGQSPEKTVENKTEERQLSSYRGAAQIIFTADSKHLVTLSEDEGVGVWDIDTQEFVRSVTKLPKVKPMSVRVACSGNVVLFVDGLTQKLVGIELESGNEIDSLQYLHGEIMSFTVSTDTNKVFILANIEGKACLTVIDMTTRKIVQTIPIKDNLHSPCIEIFLSENENFAFFKVFCYPKQLEIIRQTEKRNNLLHGRTGKHVFHAINLSKNSGELMVCNRILTTVPLLGHSCQPLNDSWVLIGRERIAVVWDLEAGVCDQRIVKGINSRMPNGIKVPMFFRPIWVEEEEEDKFEMCSGAMRCIEKSVNGEAVAVGSDDGWVMVYDTESGCRRGGKVTNRRRPSHQAAVDRVAVSSDGRWVASYDVSGTLKVWSVTGQMEELAALRLGLHLTQIVFSPDGLALALLGDRGPGTGPLKVLVFRVTGAAGQ